MEALNEVDTEIPEDRHSRFVFDTFGDRLATESLSKVNDSLYNVTVGRICTKIREPNSMSILRNLIGILLR